MQEYKRAQLVLEDGKTFSGWLHNSAAENTEGEVVFTTGMVGYPESLTDPSFAEQLVCFTYPLMGNYGVPEEPLWQSERVQAKALICDQITDCYSHRQAKSSLQKWLLSYQVPVFSGVDTRSLARHLAVQGTMAGVITTTNTQPPKMMDLEKNNLVANLQRDQISMHQKTGTNCQKTIIAVDCGMKNAILEQLLSSGARIKKVPYTYDYTADPYDGVFLSNGPGDPTVCQKTIEILQKALLQNKPIFGVCLGSQLLALAAGAKTYRLDFGHRGQNQPIQDTKTGRCFLTSQNHGYAIDQKTLPKDWSVTYKNLNDGSVEGIQHKTKPFSAVQFHPEANPGPTDTEHLFKEFFIQL